MSGLAIAFQRSAGRERSLVAINYGPTEARVRFEGLPPGAGIDGVLPRTVSAIPVDRNGQFVLMVPAHAVFVFGLTR